MPVSDELRSEIEEMGAALLELRDVELIYGQALCTDLKTCYMRGVKKTQLKLNKVIIDQAVAGSKPAQDVALNLLDVLKMNNGVSTE